MARTSNNSWFVVVVEARIILYVWYPTFIFYFLTKLPCILCTLYQVCHNDSGLKGDDSLFVNSRTLPLNSSIAQHNDTLLKWSLRHSDERSSLTKIPPAITCHWVLFLCCSLSWPRSCLSGSSLLPRTIMIYSIMSCNADQFFQKIRKHCYITRSNIVGLTRSLKEIV